MLSLMKSAVALAAATSPISRCASRTLRRRSSRMPLLPLSTSGRLRTTRGEWLSPQPCRRPWPGQGRSERAGPGLVADVVGEVATIHLMQAAGKRQRAGDVALTSQGSGDLALGQRTGIRLSDPAEVKHGSRSVGARRRRIRRPATRCPRNPRRFAGAARKRGKRRGRRPRPVA